MGLRAVPRHARIVVHVPSSETRVSRDNAVLDQFAIPRNGTEEASGVIVKVVHNEIISKMSGVKRKDASGGEHDEQELLLRKRVRGSEL
jgi:hypothetical protein